MKNRNPITGCDPAQLAGIWAVMEQPFADWQERVAAEVEAGRLAALAAESRERAALQDAAPYAVERGVARIGLTGPMTKGDTSFNSIVGGTSTVRVRHAIRAALADNEVKSILIDVDSPGGTVLGTAELANEVRRADGVKPVYAHVSGQACSAALWVASAARQVWADPTAEVGSIGAFTVLTDRSENLRRQGITKHLISTGAIKGAGSDGVGLTDAHIASIRQRVEDAAVPFVSDVASYRGMSVEDVTKIADGGRVYRAARAKELGLIDRVAYADEAMDAIATNNVSPPAATRSPAGSGLIQTAAPKRSHTMTLLAQMQSLFGAADLTEEQAVARVRSLQTQATDATAKVAALTGERDRLAGELSVLKPKPQDPQLVKGWADLTVGRIDVAVAKAELLPTIADKIKAAIAKDGKPNAFLLTPSVELGDVRPVDFVLDLFKGEKLGGPATGSQTGVQQLSRTVPGGDKAADQKAIEDDADAEAKAYRASRGITD